MKQTQIIVQRTPLSGTLECIKNGKITIGFLGGSITDSRGRRNWPEPIIRWFINQFPGLRVCSENAAIGATNSELAVFRVERDIIKRNCDLVFVEYAVNDAGIPEEMQNNTREGLLRKLLAAGVDIAIVYTYYQPMYDDMVTGRVPPSIARFEKLADHYGISSIWMGLHAWGEIKKGNMTWEEFLPDGLHPGHRGSLCYAQSVISFLQMELTASQHGGFTPKLIPPPLFSSNWEHSYILPLSEVDFSGPWELRRCTTLEWIDQTLETPAVGLGAKIGFTFEGRGISLGFEYGKKSAGFKYRLDGGDWIISPVEKPSWAPDDGWFRCINVCDNLEYGKHTFELMPIHSNTDNCLGSTFKLGFIGIIN